MEQHFDMVVIGFGKAGKTLAGAYAKTGKNVALIEQSDKMYGGTCINIGCVPTKALVARSESISGDPAKAWDDAVSFRGKLTEAMRAKNKEILESNETAKLITGHARFLSDSEVEVTAGDDVLKLTADYFIINTGATPVIPDVQGLKESKHVYTSTEIQQLTPRPASLAVIGAGPIGLEFAGIYARFGADVTVFNNKSGILGFADEDVAAIGTEILEKQGIRFINNANVVEIKDQDGAATVISEDAETGEKTEVTAEAILVATGRKAATDNLGLENTSLKLTKRGAIEVDEHLRTNVENIFAVGDVNGGPQFTYISLDDYRIVLDQLTGDGKRSTADRTAVPTTTFLEPELSTVGLTEREAHEEGRKIKVASKLVAQIAAMPRAKILGKPEGIMKFVIDAETDQILGAQLLVTGSVEVINLVAVAMRAGVTASELRDSIFNHPSITEGLNEVLATAK